MAEVEIALRADQFDRLLDGELRHRRGIHLGCTRLCNPTRRSEDHGHDQQTTHNRQHDEFPSMTPKNTTG